MALWHSHLGGPKPFLDRFQHRDGQNQQIHATNLSVNVSAQMAQSGGRKKSGPSGQCIRDTECCVPTQGSILGSSLRVGSEYRSWLA
jgi:hypothetical protein